MPQLTDTQWQAIESIMDELGAGVAYDPIYGLKARNRVVFTSDTISDFGEPEDTAEADGLTGYTFSRGRKTIYVVDLGDIRLCEGDIAR
jgi:hypothetical protein